jgi:polar amino acid transport system substrate-binding protein
MQVRSLLFGTLTVLALLIGPAKADEPVMVLGTEAAFPPFNMKDTNGKLTGFDTEIGEAICQQMKRKCEWVVTNWDGIIPALLAKKFDAILSSMSITEERQKRVAFTKPYYRDSVGFMAKKGAGITDTSPEGLKGKTIGTQRSSSQAAYLEDFYGATSTAKYYDTIDQANLDLAAGRLDLVISFRIPMSDWISKSPEGSCCELVGQPVVNTKYFGPGAGIALRKDDTVLLAEFNAAIDAVVKDGTYAKINAKYFPFSIYPK